MIFINSSEDLLSIIDSRIKKQSFNQSQYYPAKIVGVNNEDSMDYCKVRLVGYSDIFDFPNKTGKELKEGDDVFVLAINGDLNNGVISIKNSSEKEVKPTTYTGNVTINTYVNGYTYRYIFYIDNGLITNVESMQI